MPADFESATPNRRVWAALWFPGLLVAAGAAVATAHGLYEVARAASAPSSIAMLYPLITDGLALVAYAATTRLSGSARRYAWAVVVLAAGLSGLAQASYLAHGTAADYPSLRFGVGAWPAVAAAIVAHLLYLIANERHRPAAVDSADESPSLTLDAPVGSDAASAVEVFSEQQPVRTQPAVQSPSDEHRSQPAVRLVESPARDRALQAAQGYAEQHGELPTVTTLMQHTDVSRGTAGEALKTLRNQSPALHLVSETDQ